MTHDDLTKWVKHLSAIASPVIASDDRIERCAIVEPFLVATNEHQVETPLVAARGETPDVTLWRAMSDDSIEVDRIIETPTNGSLFPMDLYSAIEVWTESDLCGLHALWNLASTRARNDWMTRAHDIRDWHLEHIQPDNATNRPWALHVFLLAGTPEAIHHASILLHNCQAMHGHPDPLSARILMESARQLERATKSNACE